MTMPIRLCRRWSDGEILRLARKMLTTHMHLIGATGTGKTSAMHTILRALMLDSGDAESAMFIFDPLGNFSQELLKFIAHPDFCTPRVRERLLYIEPGRFNTIMPFNPLEDITPHTRYYKIMRAIDLILRAWEAQNVAEQPRLLQWTFKSFCAAAEMGFPISICQHLLHPGTEYHSAIMEKLPPHIKHDWAEILNPRSGNEAIRILDSTRNRLDPFFRCETLKHMFGTRHSRLDVARLIRERRVVIFNLAALGAIPGFIGDTIGALFLNQIFETASNMVTMNGSHSVPPIYVALDEFHRYVSVDIEYALATCRQMNIRLILANQSFAQLGKREDVALEQMIWEARARLVFAGYARDADLLADEIAKIMYDGSSIKDTRTSVRQLIAGYRKEWMRNYSSGNSSHFGYTNSSSTSDNSHLSTTTGLLGFQSSSVGTGTGSGRTESESSGGGNNNSSGASEVNTPILKTFDEVASKTFKDFNEQSVEFGQTIRRFKRGEAFLQLPESDIVERVLVNYLPIQDTPALLRAVEELKCRNFESEFFVTMDEAKREYEECLKDLLNRRLSPINSSSEQPKLSDGNNPFV